MKLPRKKAVIIVQAINEWTQQGLISFEQRKQMEGTIEIIPFDWLRLARYSFIVAIISFIISILSVFSDKALMKIIQLYFETPAIIKASSLGILSFLLFFWGAYRNKNMPNAVFKNEAIFTLGVFFYAATLFYIAKIFHLEPEDFRSLILFGCISYGILGFCLKSPLIWIFSILSLGGWMGAETGYLSGWGAYYLGMNYPLRFVLFGIILIAGSSLLQYRPSFIPLRKTTLVMGLLYLFVALWILSIFGNYGDMNVWYKVKQIELFHWSLLFGFFSVAAFIHGLKYDNVITRGFGLVFLFINLYTRFFEHFWDSTHKAIFFGILGISLWYLGTHAEKICNFKMEKNRLKMR